MVKAMKITVRLPISAEEQRKNSDDIEQAQRYELSSCGHNSDNSIEKEIAPHPISHTRESSDSEGEAERRSPLDLSARTIKVLMQLVEHYNDTLKEIASFTYDRQSAVNQPLAKAGPPPLSLDEVKAIMIAGTGDPSEKDAIKRRQLMIAESPDATPEILMELVHSHFTEVREAVSDHFRCTETILVCLSEDESPEVRYALAENHRLSFSILEKLTHDENPYVSVRAQRTMRRVLSNNVVPMEKRSDANDSSARANA